MQKFCAELTALFRCIQKLKGDCNEDAIEASLLCTSQIVCCVKYLERALTIEIKDGIVLTVRYEWSYCKLVIHFKF